MIPRAVEQVFRVAEFMKTKGWVYRMEGQFLEIVGFRYPLLAILETHVYAHQYNETIHDLLLPANSSEKKHEIKHDPKTGFTRVTDLTVVPLSSPSQVKNLLALAQSRRSVASTLVNERSSRSHSVFTLRISGVNVGIGNVGRGDPFSSTSTFVGGTGERCEGSLNLVDLAGSERLNVSFAPGVLADKERVKETQNINKSLSALGDVIAALGDRGSNADGGGKHIPYRNSKVGLRPIC
jgi:kinesin family protein C1